MHTPEAFLEYIATALIDGVGADIDGVDDRVAEALPGVARRVWRAWGKDRSDADRRADIEALLAISDQSPHSAAAVPDAADMDHDDLSARPADEFHRLASNIARSAAAGQPPDVRRVLAAYLEQVPANIRRWLRRPEDPSGTRVPSQLQLHEAEDLLPLLPLRVAHFEPGRQEVADTVWELIELLGVNEYSETWKARHTDSADSSPVVLKFFTQTWAARLLRSDALAIDRVMLHARHPHMVPLRQVFLSADPPYLEYDYVAGSDLAGMLHEWKRAQVRPNPVQLAQIILRLAKTLAFAHRLVPPLVHRALKPANVLVHNAADGRPIYRIADLASGVVAGSHAVRQALKGASAPAQRAAALRGSCTGLYASPQQLRGADVGPRDDIHALGVMWVQLLTGDLTSGPPVSTRQRKNFEASGMAPALAELLASCVAENPEERPRDAGTLAVALAKHLNVESESLAAIALPVQEPESRTMARRIVNCLDMSLAILPAGSFKMGSPFSEAERGDDEGPQHDVMLSKTVYMGVHPVTQRQYELVMGRNPSYFQGAKGGGPDYPVETVSWHEAVEFCRKLSELPAEREAGRVYRLPTEAEWEYACRAGQGTPFTYGLTISSRDANFNGNYPYGQASRGPYLEKTSRVGSYAANAFGLYDVHGNVWEWCSDYYHLHFYRSSPPNDPGGPSSGTLRVVRGGSCYSIGRFCRSAYRFGIAPANRDLDVGLRVVAEVRDGAEATAT
jgi:formylglycine-generating enzyme required for sulfatase activity